MKTITDYIKEYLSSIKQTGSRRRKISELASELRHFALYIEEYGIDPLALGMKGALGYQRYLCGKKTAAGADRSHKSVNSLVGEAKSLYAYLVEQGIAAANPFTDIRHVRELRVLPKNILRENKTEELLSELERFDCEPSLPRAIRRYRAHVVCELLYSTGMRISEAQGIREEDVDIDRKRVTIREAKTGKTRIGFLNDYACEVLRLYITTMRRWTANRFHRGNGSLFGSADALTIQTNKTLKEACAKLGLPETRSHGFRHAFGSHMLRAGCDIRLIQELLGHSLLRTTQVYTKVEKEDLRDVLDRFHPRQWCAVDTAVTIVENNSSTAEANA